MSKETSDNPIVLSTSKTITFCLFITEYYLGCKVGQTKISNNLDKLSVCSDLFNIHQPVANKHNSDKAFSNRQHQ